MSCRHCTRRLSEHIDGTLDRGSRARVDEHLARCSSCAATLRELEEARRLLRNASGAQPPDGLAEGILLKLASAQRPARSMRARRIGGARTRAAAAAALVLAALAGLLAWQGRSVSGRVAELESEVSGMRDRWESEKAVLAGALERTREELRAARADAERAEVALHAQAAGRERLEDAVARFEAAVRAETDRAARIAEELRAESGRAAALESEVAALREGRARQRDGVALAARMDPDPVVFRRHGGRLELETRGSPHVFIPRLFELARDETDPEISSLALDSLEGILGMGEPALGSGADPDPPDPRVGPVKWVRRGVAVFTSATGLEGAPVEDAPPPEPPRERRLRAIESVWRHAAGAEG